MYLLAPPRQIPILLALIFAAFLTSASGQTSLFSVPTADVLQEGGKYLEFDLDTHLGNYRKGGLQSHGLFSQYGAGKNLEVGLNGYLVRDMTGLRPVELQPNVKFKVYENESIGLSAATGVVAYLPLSRGFRRESVVSIYAVAKKQFQNTRVPVLHGGMYKLVGPGAEKGRTTGVLLGLEQRIMKKISFIADWRSGRNRFGYAAAGLSISLTKRSFLSPAYYFGNEGRGNNSLGIYYGYSF